MYRITYYIHYEKSQKHTLDFEHSLKHDQYSTAYCLQVSRVSNEYRAVYEKIIDGYMTSLCQRLSLKPPLIV